MNVKQCDINFFITTLSQNNYTATDIRQLLSNVWGEENLIKVRRIQAIAKEFQNGRLSIGRKEGSARPRTSCSEDNVQLVRELIDDNPRLSCADISRLTGIQERSVNRILSDKLKKKSLCCRWVPHELGEDHKNQRIAVGRELLEVLRRRNIKNKLIVIDKKWVFFNSIPPKECNRVWVDSAGDRPQQPRRSTGDRKTMVLVAANYSKTFTYCEALEDGGSINADRYLIFLQNLFNAFENDVGMPRWELNLQHDNARPHVAIRVRQWFESENITLVKQPPYSPDYNLMDRMIFRNYEVYRRNINFNSANEVLLNVRQFLEGLTAPQLDREFHKLIVHIQSVIEQNGNYL